MEEESAHLCKDELMGDVSLDGDRKKVSGCSGDTLRRDALKRADNAVWARDFMQPWLGAVENGVGVVPL